MIGLFGFIIGFALGAFLVWWLMEGCWRYKNWQDGE
jgi:biotin transporter BioY